MDNQKKTGTVAYYPRTSEISEKQSKNLAQKINESEKIGNQ